MSAFHVHHAGHGNPSRLPLSGWTGEVAYGADVAGEIFAQEESGRVAEGVGVVRVKIGWHRTATLVAEVVRLWREAGFVGAGGLHFLQAGLDEVDEKALGIDAGDLHIAVRITIKDKLVRNVVRKAPVKGRRRAGQMTCHELPFLRKRFERVEGIPMLSENFIELTHQCTHFRNKFNKAFGNQNRAKFFSLSCAVTDDVGDLINDLLKGEPTFSHLLGNERDIRVGLKCTFKGDVGGRASHELDEVPVFPCRNGVPLDVADQVGINLGGCVKAKARFDIVAPQIAIDGFGNADDAER